MTGKITKLMVLSVLAWGWGICCAAEQFPVVVEATARAVLSAEAEGVLTELNVDVGDSVKQNDVLASVFNAYNVLRKEKLEAAEKYLEIQVENLTQLHSRGLTTDEEFARAKMELEVNRKEIESVKIQIERSQIRAPFAGRIVARFLQPYEWVRPGQPVVELYDPLALRISADIPANIAMTLKTGQTNTMHFPALKQEVKVRLKMFAPLVDVRSDTIKIFWEVSRPELRKINLMPGMKGVLKLGSE